MTKRVVLTTVGSTGDVHPFIAVGKALQSLGFEVVIAAIEALREKVEKEGLAFHAVRPTAEQVLADTGMDEATFLQEIAQTNTALIIKKSILPYIE
jgi:UDP:flavonoid glycosyltransferase YjiC (YdhE family)